MATKKIACYSDLKRRGHGMLWGTTWENTGIRGRRNMRKMWAKAFIVVFTGRNEQGRVRRLNRFRISYSEYFSEL